MVFLYTCVDTVDTMEPSATPMTDPVKPMIDEKVLMRVCVSVIRLAVPDSPLPALAAAVCTSFNLANTPDQIRATRLPAALIQGQRDFFGSKIVALVGSYLTN